MASAWVRSSTSIKPLVQQLGADGGEGIAVVIALEILAIDEDPGALGNGQRQLGGGAIGGGGDQQLLGGGAQGNAGALGGAGAEKEARRQTGQKAQREK